jgi:hypothetical protein
MGTLTLVTIRNLVRSDLNETTTTILSDTELNSIINDGYKDVAIKGLCYENKITKDNIPTSQRMVSLIDQDPKVVRVNYVEYKSGATQGGVGMMGIIPQAVGYTPINLNVPQYWFQWGNILVIDPLPDAATYDLAIYAACIPTPVLSADGDKCDDIPVEFHECVYLFALAFAALKIRRWGDAATTYNKYITSLQQKRAEYIMKYADSRFSHEIPDNVTPQMQEKGV